MRRRAGIATDGFDSDEYSSSDVVGHEASASGSDGYDATLLRNKNKGPSELPTGQRADSAETAGNIWAI